MSNSVASILNGQDYQGRIFLKYAAQLRIPGKNIEKVGYEDDLFRAFDDVTVYYKKPLIDEQHNRDVKVDCFQVKFKMLRNSTVTWDTLMDPKFIGANTFSLLYRLKEAAYNQDTKKVNARFILLIPLRIENELQEFISNRTGEIDSNVFFSGTQRSKKGCLRAKLRQHLQIETDEELRKILTPFRIYQSPNLTQLQHELDVVFTEAGLYCWNTESLSNKYDDFPRTLVKSKIKVFDHTEINRLFVQEGFISGPPIKVGQSSKNIGIRSYMPFAERMPEETDRMCCLVEHFDNRMIHNPALWEEEINPKVREFMQQEVVSADVLNLHLAVHSTIAFAAGWHYNTKASIDIAPIQKGVPWRPDHSLPKDSYPMWQPCTIEQFRDASDYAVCISITHEVLDDVRDYAQRQLPSVGSILHFQLSDGAGQASIRDGTHAYRLAEILITEILKNIPRSYRHPVVHFFMAAPNGLVFFIGRMSNRLSTVVMYEYDFLRQHEEPYIPSLTFSYH